MTDTSFDEADGTVIAQAPFDEGDGTGSVLRGAAKAAALLTVAGIVGQVFTLIRELFIAGKVGVSSNLDALLVAAVFPILLASLLGSGTGAAIIPGYLATSRDHGQAAADRLLGATVTWTVIIGIAFSILVVLGSGLTVEIAGPGLDEAARSTAAGFVPLLAPLLVFSAASGLLGATFQIHDRMRSIALAWIAGPLASMLIAILLWGNLGITALALAMTAQQAVEVIVLIGLAIRFGIMPPITIRADRAESSRFLRHAIPLTISSSVLQLNLLTDRAVASLIETGAVSALRYAEGVIRIPLNAIGPAWFAAIYPALVRTSLIKGSNSFGQTAEGALRYLTVIFVPIMIATAALAPVIVEVAYVRGAFDERAAILTSGALAGFAPLLFLTLANGVLSGAHNARQRGTFLMSIGILNAILNAVFNVGFGLWIGVAGVALSTSVTLGIGNFIKTWRLGTLEDGFPLAALLVASARSLVASLIVAAPIALIAWNLPHGMGLPTALALLVGLTAAGMVGYIALSRLIGLHEPWQVAKAMLLSPLRLRPGHR